MKLRTSPGLPRPAVLLSLLLILCGANTPLIGQTESLRESWRWARFTTETGLPSDQILCLEESTSGITWVGTQAGLAWYDNYRWHSIDSSELSSSPITHIEPYGNDSVIVLSRGALYAGNSQHFSLLVARSGEADYIQYVTVTADKRILILGSLTLFEYSPRGLRRLKTPANPISSSWNLWRTASGKIWLNTARGLYRMDGNTWRLVIPVEKYEFTTLSVIEDKKGNGIAAVSWPREILGIREWSKNSKPHLSPTERLGMEQAIDVAPNGDVVAVYESGDIRVRRDGAWSSLEPRPIEFTSTHLLKFRRNGDLWVGTERGLFLCQMLSNRWTYWKHPFGDLRNGVHEIFRTQDGSIWLGTFHGLEIHRPNGRISYIEKVLNTELGTVTGINEDNNHNIWICSGSSFQGAFRWDGKAWKHFGPSEGLYADRVHKIRKDRSGRFWFLGLGLNYTELKNQPGAFLYENGKFTNWGAKDNTHDGLINGRVYAFAEGPDGARWFGTLGGLSRWKNGTWKHWTEKTGLLLENERIYALAIDSSGTVWFSNVGAGLGTVDKEDNVHFLTTADGLVNNSIWDLKVDERGALWISTQRGLSCYKDGSWSSFTIQNGLSTPNLWDILALKDKVYVGSPGGGVNILSVTSRARPPIVRLAKPSVEGTTALLRWTVFPFLGDMDPKEIEVRYKIDNMKWSKWTTDREVSLSQLASGDHIFEIQAKSLFGDISEQGSSLTLQVEPHLLQRVVFLVPVSLLILLLLVLGGAYLHRKRRYQRALRESDERFRLVASTTTDLIYDWNLVTNEVWTNDPNRSLFEGERTSIASAKDIWLQHVHPEDRPQLEESINRAIAKKSSTWQSEYRFAKPDGTNGHMLHRGYLMFDVSGNATRALGSVMDITDRKQAEEFSRDISRRIIEAQESERRRVSRELHDSVNQILASVKFRIESLEEQLPSRNVRVKREAFRTKQLMNRVMTEVRRISRNLRPAELDDLGLASAVRSFIEEFAERTKIAVSMKGSWPKRDLLPEVKLTLYRIVQESLTNVEKHAKAKRVRLECNQSEGEIVCKIEDNGQGIHLDEHGKSKIRGDGLGLLDMRERLSFLGGTIEISSNENRGTTVIVRIPCP
jgi:PAS domain S-box-containing protein